MKKFDFKTTLFTAKQTVFSIKEIALLLEESDLSLLKARVHYYVKKGILINIRKGFYAKAGYHLDELACKLYAPSYISLEQVLQSAGVVFQYTDRITMVSYLSRNVLVNGKTIGYKKIKTDVLLNLSGIIKKETVNIASPERAFLDALYFYKNYYFDNLNGLDKNKINKLLPIYSSQALQRRSEALLT